MYIFRSALFSVAALSLAVAAGMVNHTAAQTKSTVRVQGSLSIAGQVDAWGKAFSEAGPDVSILVIGGGIKSAFKALADNTAEIVMTARQATQEEKAAAAEQAAKLTERQIGSEALEVFVNAGVAVKELTLEQLSKIYKGEFTNWKQVGGPDLPIVARSMPDQPRGPAEWFKNEVMQGAGFGGGVQFSKYAELLVKGVAADAGALGYLGQSLLSSQLKRLPDAKVTVLQIKKDASSAAMMPSPESAKSGTYPLATNLYFYWNAAAPKKGVVEFVDFCVRKASEPQ